MSAVLSFIVSLLICKSLAINLVFVNNSREVAPKIFDYVVTFDTVTQQSKAYRTSIPSGDELVSGGVVCGNIYYGVWVDVPVSMGMFAFDLLNGNLTSYIEFPGNNFHVLECTETEGTILGVSNDFSSTPVFELDRVVFQGGSKFTRTTIGKFPTSDDPGGDGYDSTFSFYSAKNELWASFPNKKYSSGDLYVMDTTTGTIKNSYSYPRNYGLPYFTLPSTLKGSSFKGASANTADGDVDFYTLTYGSDGTSLDTSNKIPCPYMWSSGQPFTVCNGTAYSVDPENKIITAWDTETGKKVTTYNMATILKNANIEVGDLACYD